MVLFIHVFVGERPTASPTPCSWGDPKSLSILLWLLVTYRSCLPGCKQIISGPRGKNLWLWFIGANETRQPLTNGWEAETQIPSRACLFLQTLYKRNYLQIWLSKPPCSRMSVWPTIFSSLFLSEIGRIGVTLDFWLAFDGMGQMHSPYWSTDRNSLVFEWWEMGAKMFYYHSLVCAFYPHLATTWWAWTDVPQE